MNDSTYYLQSLLSKLGRGVGYMAFTCRQKRDQFEHYEQQMLQWRKIFHLGEVIALGLAAMAFIIMDFSCLLPIYRQVSQLIVNDADLLVFPIGIAINMVGIVCSERLSKCAASGSFYHWNNWTNGALNSNAEVLFFNFNRRQFIQEFLLNMGIYLMILGALIWMRHILLTGQDTQIVAVEWQVSLVGLLFSCFAVTLGVYLIPLFQYVFWSIQSNILNTQVSSLIRRVAEQDSQIFSLWNQIGRPTDTSHDLKEALVRVLFRTKGFDYCNPVTSEEVEYLIAFQGQPFIHTFRSGEMAIHSTLNL